MIWIILAILSGAAAVFIMVPILNRSRINAGPERVDVFERQLDEIASDETHGVIGADEATAARIEVKRRILNARDDDHGRALRTTHGGRNTLVIAVIAALGSSMALYLAIGSPGVEDFPYRPPASQIADAPTEGPDLDVLVDRLTAHLEANPEDMQGWVHFRRAAPDLDRQADLAWALARASAARPDNPMLAMMYAESLILLGGGQVTPAASLALARVRDLAPDNPALGYYEGLAFFQNGKVNEARARWQALLETSPADAPWRSDVERRLAQADRALGVTPAGDTTGDVATVIANLPEEERADAIRDMVEGLAARLEDEPGNLDGWMRLAQSWEVLGENARALTAWVHVRNMAQETGRNDLAAEAARAVNRLGSER
ncbi:MAG: c-type cytochrome biogenesis protein CcmI [Sphingomonadales bacterium]